jgi:hypothetical protein
MSSLYSPVLNQELNEARSLLQRLSHREDVSDDFCESVGLTRPQQQGSMDIAFKNLMEGMSRSPNMFEMKYQKAQHEVFMLTQQLQAVITQHEHSQASKYRRNPNRAPRSSQPLRRPLRPPSALSNQGHPHIQERSLTRLHRFPIPENSKRLPFSQPPTPLNNAPSPNARPQTSSLVGPQAESGQLGSSKFQRPQIQTFPLLLGVEHYMSPPGSPKLVGSNTLDSPTTELPRSLAAIDEAVAVSPKQMTHSMQPEADELRMKSSLFRNKSGELVKPTHRPPSGLRPSITNSKLSQSLQSRQQEAQRQYAMRLQGQAQHQHQIGNLSASNMAARQRHQTVGMRQKAQQEAQEDHSDLEKVIKESFKTAEEMTMANPNKTNRMSENVMQMREEQPRERQPESQQSPRRQSTDWGTMANFKVYKKAPRKTYSDVPSGKASNGQPVHPTNMAPLSHVTSGNMKDSLMRIGRTNTTSTFIGKVGKHRKPIPISKALSSSTFVHTSKMSSHEISYTISEDCTRSSTRHRLRALEGGNRHVPIELSKQSHM